MQVTYDGKHSLLIGDLKMSTTPDAYGRYVERFDESLFLNTWDDYHLIPVSRPVIDPPEVQENTVEVPGSNGLVDLTEVLLGHPLYYNRSGSLDFYVDSTYSWTWDTAYDTLLNDLHGFQKKVILTDAKGFYYDGRLKVNSWKSDKLCSTISIDYNFAPYKRMLFTSEEDWLWDPFDFVNGYIIDKSEAYEATVEAGTVGVLTFDRTTGGIMPVVPDLLLQTASDIHEAISNVSVKVYTSTISEDDSKNHFSEVDAKPFSVDEMASGTTNCYFLKHDPLIVLGSPQRRWTSIQIINNSAVQIKMGVDFRQGRL